MPRLRLSRRGRRFLLGAALLTLTPGEGRAMVCLTYDASLNNVQVERTSGPADGLEEETDRWLRGRPWHLMGDDFAIFVGWGEMEFEAVHE